MVPAQRPSVQYPVTEGVGWDERLSTMHRARFGFVIVLAIAGLVGLSGCQNDPNQAVRISDVTVTDAQIEAIAQRFAADLAAHNPQFKDPVGQVRQSVAELTVFNELARRYASEKGIELPTPDYEATAAQYGAPADDPFVRLNAETSAYLTALRDHATPREPTESDVQDVYRRYKELAGADAQPYDVVKQALKDVPEYPLALGLRSDLLAALDRYGLSVNPRYQPLNIPLLAVSQGQLVLVDLPMGDQGTGAVRDVS